MSDTDASSRSVTLFDPIIVGIVIGACLLFLFGGHAAGKPSLMCDPSPAKIPEGGFCDVAGHPMINAYLASIITPLAPTLATNFGAAMGIADTQARTALTLQNLWQFLLRWGGLIRGDSKIYSWFQTGAAYVFS